MNFKKRDLLFFLAGAEAFHTIVHIGIGLSGNLPLHFFFITLACRLNLFAVVVNAAITAGLFVWACKTKPELK